jgi:transposase
MVLQGLLTKINGVLYSVGSRWNIDEEAFMDDIFYRCIKIKRSYGTVGKSYNMELLLQVFNLQNLLIFGAVGNNACNGGTGYNITLVIHHCDGTTHQWECWFRFRPKCLKCRLRGNVE